MPIYEYRCSACGFQNDYLQKLTEPPLTDCPECGKSTFTKQVTAAGFQLKGTGWYVTDFKNNNKGKPANGKDASKTADDKSSGGTDSASKSEPAAGSTASSAGS